MRVRVPLPAPRSPNIRRCQERRRPLQGICAHSTSRFSGEDRRLQHGARGFNSGVALLERRGRARGKRGRGKSEMNLLLSLVSCLLSLVSCLVVSCLLSLVSCLLSLVSCLLSLGPLTRVALRALWLSARIEPHPFNSRRGSPLVSASSSSHERAQRMDHDGLVTLDSLIRSPHCVRFAGDPRGLREAPRAHAALAV